MAKRKSHKGWIVAAVIFGIAALIDIFVPDPVPFVDEIILIGGTMMTAYKAWFK